MNEKPVVEAKCDGVINLANPRSQENSHEAFGRRKRVVYTYECPKCRSVHRVLANSFRGPNPVPGVGAIVCGRSVS